MTGDVFYEDLKLSPTMIGIKTYLLDWGKALKSQSLALEALGPVDASITPLPLCNQNKTVFCIDI